MRFFNKLFGGNNETNSNADNAEIWPAKFLLLSITETLGEAPSLDDVKVVIENSFPNFPQSELSNVHSSVMTLHEKSANSDTEWDKIWDNFSSQLKTFKLSETFSVVREVASVAFFLKMEEGMEKVAENYTYRMGQSEKYLQISKPDFMAILKEEAENTGYNAYRNNL